MSREIQTVATAMALAMSLSVPMAASAADAMRVVRDPATGELRSPTAAEAAAYQAAEAQLRASKMSSAQLAAKAAGPVEITHPDGAVEMKLDEDSMMFSVVSSNAEGTLNFNCLPTKQARKFVLAAKKPSAAKATVKASHDHQ